MINVLVVDDYPLFMEGVRTLFLPGDGISVVASTVDATELTWMLSIFEIDVVMLDIEMPILNGLDALDLMKKRGHHQPVIMLTTHQSLKYIKAAMKRGALGYLPKSSSKKVMVDAIRSVYDGKYYLHEEISKQVFDSINIKADCLDFEQLLSSRELEIVRSFASGMSQKDISLALFIDHTTVSTYLRNILHKLNLNSLSELILYAKEYT